MGEAGLPAARRLLLPLLRRHRRLPHPAEERDQQLCRLRRLPRHVHLGKVPRRVSPEGPRERRGVGALLKTRATSRAEKRANEDEEIR